MNNSVHNFVENCSACKTYARSKTSQTISPFEKELGPLHYVDTDICTFDQTNYLVLVDRFSGFLWAHALKSMTSSAIINILYKIWMSDGTPINLRSDNGPNYVSQEFKDFCKTMNVTHVTSSPYFPQSNGRAEIAVQTLKHLLRKNENKLPLEVLLASYNSTPLRESDFSPFELKNGRPFRFHSYFLPSLQYANKNMSHQDDLHNRRHKRRVKYEKLNQSRHRDSLALSDPPIPVYIQNPHTKIFDNKIGRAHV